MSKQKAVVVGVSVYPDAAWNLPGVAADVREMAKLLGSPAGQFQQDEVTVLTDGQATAAAVRSGLESVLLGAGRDDTVFAYLAGHGDSEGDQYFFIAHDSTVGDLKDVGLPLTVIKDIFDRCPSRRAFLFLDFCRSGGIFRRTPRRAEDERAIINRALRVVQGEGKIIVAACTETQYAEEDSLLGHGVFTAYLLKGLRGEAAQEGEVTAHSLFDFIDRKMGSSRQRPMMFGHSTGRIVLMHYGTRVGAGHGPAPATHSQAGAVCDSSDDWVLLHNRFWRADEVNHNGDGTISVVVEARTAEENAAIQQLQPSRPDRLRSVAFAHGDDAQVVSVGKLEGRSAGGKRSWTVTLKPEDTRSGGFLTEMSYQGVSADEIARRRAGRLLLNDPPSPQTGSGPGVGFDLVEVGIKGDGKNFPPVDFCILQAVHAEYKDRPELFPPYARLAAIHALKASGCVEQVLELAVGPVQGGKCHVRFRGRRARRYSNVEPHVITLEGDCPLG